MCQLQFNSVFLESADAVINYLFKVVVINYLEKVVYNNLQQQTDTSYISVLFKTSSVFFCYRSAVNDLQL